MKRLLFSVLALAALASCTKESIKTTFSAQETRIETFINAQLKADESRYLVSDGGVQRLVLTEGEGEELSSGGVVSFYYAGYVFSGSSLSASGLFATNNADVAEASSWELSDEDAFKVLTVKLSDSGFVDGLRRGLVGVKGGEECYILFSGKYGFGKKALGTIPANSALAYHVWVESVSNE